MRMKWSGRRVGAGLGVAAGVMALVALTGAPAAASPLFDGGGRGPTAADAIRRAFWDAQITAQSEGFYGGCTVVGTPAIFETLNDPNFGHVFRAQLTISCLP